MFYLSCHYETHSSDDKISLLKYLLCVQKIGYSTGTMSSSDSLLKLVLKPLTYFNFILNKKQCLKLTFLAGVEVGSKHTW